MRFEKTTVLGTSLPHGRFFCFRRAKIFRAFNVFSYFRELKVMHNTTMGLQNQLLLDLYKDKASVFTMRGVLRHGLKDELISLLTMFKAFPSFA